MRQSIEQARTMKLPAFQGVAPPPRAGAQDLSLAAMESRRNLLRRSGLQSTLYAAAA